MAMIHGAVVPVPIPVPLDSKSLLVLSSSTLEGLASAWRTHESVWKTRHAVSTCWTR